MNQQKKNEKDIISKRLLKYNSREINEFEQIKIIGDGTYGKVIKAREKKTGEIIALKKIKVVQEKEGFPITALREIMILQKLDHKNIIKLKEIVTSRLEEETRENLTEFYLVFEYMDHDLVGLTNSPQIPNFSLPQIKCYFQQLLEALLYCHKKQIVHRDVKAANLLINNKGELKLADFGLARSFQNSKNIDTSLVVTLWYRAPELLLGTKKHSPAIDMWSAGCVLAELFMRKPLFPGSNVLDQLDLIFSLCGSPDSCGWKSAEYLPLMQKYSIKKDYCSNIQNKFRILICSEGIDLLEKLLDLDPERRFTAQKALDHDFFWTDPMPAQINSFQAYSSCYEIDVKDQRRHLSLKSRSKAFSNLKNDIFVEKNIQNQRIANHNIPKSFKDQPNSFSSNQTFNPKQSKLSLNSYKLIPNQIPNQNSNQIPNQNPNQISNQIPNQIPNQISNQIPNQFSNQISNSIKNKIPNSIKNKIPNIVLNPIPDSIKNKIPNQTPNQIPYPHKKIHYQDFFQENTSKQKEKNELILPNERKHYL
ncbi:binding protein [Anaeramoeba ignava]|uniref:Binding protein n=1 Tax=Anaeramoeba ignava TaxID=1746090 RepID=A0A9Q0RAH8_ANAIG|nr:binding protein [Anaeramoeba ignava]